MAAASVAVALPRHESELKTLCVHTYIYLYNTHLFMPMRTATMSNERIDGEEREKPQMIQIFISFNALGFVAPKTAR